MLGAPGERTGDAGSGLFAIRAAKVGKPPHRDPSPLRFMAWRLV
jgi:hypothetical protein